MHIWGNQQFLEKFGSEAHCNATKECPTEFEPPPGNVGVGSVPANGRSSAELMGHVVRVLNFAVAVVLGLWAQFQC